MDDHAIVVSKAILPECKDEVVAVDPKFPSEELPKAAEGGAA